MTAKMALIADDDDDRHVITIDGRTSRDLMRRIAVGSLTCFVAFLKNQLANAGATIQPPLTVTDANKEVMTADEVAAFLGVDRNTVYDYAGRGVIPHQRLGKRVLFRLGALVSWLDTSCKATLIRKG